MPSALYEPQQFIIASGVYTSQGSSGAAAPLRVWTPLARNLNPRRGLPRLEGLNVSLINPDCHHPQLLELCELKSKKRWSNHL